MTDRRRINGALWFLLVFIALAAVSRSADVSQRFPVVASAVFAGVMLLAIAFLGAAQRRKQERGKDGNNCYDYQKFDQREAAANFQRFL